MDGTPVPRVASGVCAEVEDRAAPRFTLLIRSAKLIADDRAYLCVVRDISATGISIRTFHPLPVGERLEIEFQTGQHYPIERVWERDGEAGFRFFEPIDVDAIIGGHGAFPKRDLRFALELPVSLQIGGETLAATLVNISRQGGSIMCERTLSIAQPIRLTAPGLPEIEARVRWRKQGQFGLIFDTTFSLANLAMLLRNINVRAVSGSRIAAASSAGGGPRAN